MLLKNRLTTALITVILKVLSFMPLWLVHSLGNITGLLLWLFPNQLAHAAKTNLSACFPKLNSKEKKRLLLKTLCHTGKAIWEVPYIWFGNPERLLKKIIHVDGLNAFKKAYHQGNGVIVLVPHFGSWEAASIFGAKHFNTATLYKPPKQVFLREIVKHAREKLNTRMFPTSKKGVRALYKAIRQGHAACILPDHDPRKNGGIFVPFFGIAAMTMTLATHLARKTKAPSFIVCARRLPWARGYHLIIKPLGSALYDIDDVKAVSAMNQAIERCVKMDITQYIWTYRRFKTRPTGESPFY